MGPSKVKKALQYVILACAISIFCQPLGASTDQGGTFPQHLPYLVHRGQLDKALTLYEKAFNTCGKHDSTCLEQIAMGLLEQGGQSSDPEEQLMALFGAGISMDDRALPILGKALEEGPPQMQLVALNLLSRSHSDEGDRRLLRALQDNNLLVRLEAAYHIASKKLPGAAGYIESLMSKFPEQLLVLFAPLYAMINDAESVRMLKKLLSHHNENVRIAAIISSAESGRDDLLPKIRALASHPSALQQKACAMALGKLKDEASEPMLRTLARHHSPNVQLAALYALYNLGRHEAAAGIDALAQQGHLYAIDILGKIPGYEGTLNNLLASRDLSIKVNAALGLLQQCDPRCVIIVKDILIKDVRDIAFEKVTSQSRIFSCWKAVPSARQNFSDDPMALEISLHFRESVLAEAVSLPEDYFLQLATTVFESQQNDLIPVLIESLEMLASDKGIALLKKYQQQAGAPLLRNYCNLALYRLKVEGPFADQLKMWVRQQVKAPMIQLRPIVPWELSDNPASSEISADAISKLLVGAYEAFAQRQDDEGINMLIEAIKNGSSKNKYALAGLLMRASL